MTFISPRRRYYSKITTGKPMHPYSFICYLGTIELRYPCKSKEQARKKLVDLIQIDHIGHFSSEGLGKIKWTDGKVTSSQLGASPKFYPKLKIRKGLPHTLSKETKKLIQYALLHDFYHTSKHQSKIYVEPELEDKNLVRQLRDHHEKSTEPIIKQFQKYDAISAMITRSVRSPKTSRYNWRSTKNIDFEKLARELKEVANNIYKLYEYIYQSKELAKLNESLQYGHTSLRNHLVIIANLIVRDYQRGKL
ncbi:MAG: hypothetical protein ACFFCZ_30070 [Promethearchaeota archaeon]